MIAIIDYGLGNIRALCNIYERSKIPFVVAATASQLSNPTKLILPGVGAFDHAIRKFNASGMRETVEDLVLRQAVPLLGICVGMQILARSSDEGVERGLGWIEGKVSRFGPSRPLPHMGWNGVRPTRPSPLFRGLEQEARFYFLHSYHYECQDPEDILAWSDYGGRFPCAVNRGNISGVQFHPEKSHHFGGKLLKNFADL